jgi:protein-disulfide isomerase
LLTVVEFCNYESPFCRRALPKLAALKQKYGPEIRFVFKTALQPMHQHARLAAEAALAAHAQGKFWEYHQALYKNPTALAAQHLERYAELLGLDVARFRSELQAGNYRAQVEADHVRASQRLRLAASPYFFVNGRPALGAQPLTVLERLCDEELARARLELGRGTSRADLYSSLTTGQPEDVPAATAAGEPDPNAVYEIDVGAEDAVRGPRAAKVTIVQFSDFECEGCRVIGPVLRELVTSQQGQLRVVFKHLPLPDHLHAPLAAEASLAAREQGRFWEFHDRLIAEPGAPDRATLERVAADTGLDLTRFAAALRAGTYRARWQADRDLAARLHVPYTPYLFVNGRVFAENAAGSLLENLRVAITRAARDADAALARGVPEQDLYAHLVAGGLRDVPTPARTRLDLARK